MKIKEQSNALDFEKYTKEKSKSFWWTGRRCSAFCSCHLVELREDYKLTTSWEIFLISSDL